MFSRAIKTYRRGSSASVGALCFFVAVFAVLGRAEEPIGVFSPAQPQRVPAPHSGRTRDNSAEIIDTNSNTTGRPGAQKAEPAKTTRTALPDAVTPATSPLASDGKSELPAGEEVPLTDGRPISPKTPAAPLPLNSKADPNPRGTGENAEPIATSIDLNKARPVPEKSAEPVAVPPAPDQAVNPKSNSASGEHDSEKPSAPLPPIRILRSFKELIDLPDDKFDVAEVLLVLGAEPGFELSADAGETLTRVDKIAERAKAQLPDHPQIGDYFDAFYDIVLGRRPSDAAHEERAEDFDLSRAVFQHHGNCLSVGIATLAVARRMGAPVYGVQVPGHFFLRGIKVAKDRAREATMTFDATRPTPDNWGKLDDDFYRHWRHFDSKTEASGGYLRPMTDKEVISAYLASRAGFLAADGKYAEALVDTQRALALNSKNVYAFINAGYAREKLKNLEEAEADYKRALELDPQSIRALNNLAFVKICDRHQAAVYDPKKAEKLIDQAIKIDPDQAFLYATKGEVCAVRGDYKAATHNLQVALSLAPKNAAYRERFMALREHLRRDIPPDGGIVDMPAGQQTKRDRSGNPIYH